MRISDWSSDVCSSDLVIILGARVDIVDDQTDRCARRAAFENTGQNPDRIGLPPLAGEARAARPASVEPGLYILLAEGETRRAAVDDGADGGAVAFPPGRHAEQMSEAVEAHRSSSAT